ncbi:hypothetical protein FACS189491_12240 [Spirochaetia bacterium]|nr:hypothetical protein FACS189491_12240 [Spirochaetia bacterium]
MPNQTETRLPWGQDNITITGRNAGAAALTVHFDGETLNIVDFLNTNLNAEYAALYEALMSKYEAKLKTGSLFDHGFPETTFPGKKIDPSKPIAPLPTTDKELIEVLVAEYSTCLEHLKAHFKEYETAIEKWFNELPAKEKKS